MDKKLKTKWVKALRSGKYRQTNGVLKDKAGFCCLGVLRDVANPADEREHADEYLLSPEQCEEFGIAISKQKILADLNDGNEKKGIPKHSFREIANYIEKNL